jgi:hypothetical protein
MDVEQQQGTWTQLSLFEWVEGSARPGASREGKTGPAAFEEWQASTTLNRERALTSDLFQRGMLRYNHRWKPPDTISTSGGVGGRGPRGPLLPDSLKTTLVVNLLARLDTASIYNF